MPDTGGVFPCVPEFWGAQHPHLIIKFSKNAKLKNNIKINYIVKDPTANVVEIRGVNVIGTTGGGTGVAP